MTSTLSLYLPAHLVGKVQERLDNLQREGIKTPLDIWRVHEMEDATSQLKMHDGNVEMYSVLALISWIAFAAFIVIGTLFALAGDVLMSGLIFTGSAILVGAASYSSSEWASSAGERDRLLSEVALHMLRPPELPPSVSELVDRHYDPRGIPQYRADGSTLYFVQEA